MFLEVIYLVGLGWTISDVARGFEMITMSGRC